MFEHLHYLENNCKSILRMHWLTVKAGQSPYFDRLPFQIGFAHTLIKRRPSKWISISSFELLQKLYAKYNNKQNGAVYSYARQNDTLVKARRPVNCNWQPFRPGLSSIWFSSNFLYIYLENKKELDRGCA